MPDALQRAATGRAKCRGCERPIAKGELRFGEALPNPYAEGEAMFWFHLACGASMRPEKFLALLGETSEAIAGRDDLVRCAEEGIAHPKLTRLSRAERSPSARARCRQCRNPIEKGLWRLALQVVEDGRPNPIGTIHASCAENYFGTRDVLDRVRRLSPEMTERERDELRNALNEPAPAPAEDELAKTTGESDAEDAGERSAS